MPPKWTTGNLLLSGLRSPCKHASSPTLPFRLRRSEAVLNRSRVYREQRLTMRWRAAQASGSACGRPVNHTRASISSLELCSTAASFFRALPWRSRSSDDPFSRPRNRKNRRQPWPQKARTLTKAGWPAPAVLKPSILATIWQAARSLRSPSL